MVSGRWRRSQSRRRLPDDWPQRRKAVLERDGYRCTRIREDTDARCTAPATDVDHIVEWADGGTDDIRNLASLCSWHHDRKTSRHAGARSARARKAREKRARPKHPGRM